MGTAAPVVSVVAKRVCLSADVLDDLDEFVGAVAVLAGVVDKFAGALDDDAAFRCTCDGDAASAAEFEEAFVAQEAQRPQDGIAVDVEDGGEIFGGREPFARLGFAVGDCAADLGGDLLVQGRGVVISHLDIHGATDAIMNTPPEEDAMTVATPPRPPDLVPRDPVQRPDPEALIKEARRRARRRRTVFGAAAATVVAVAGIATFNLAGLRDGQEPGIDSPAGAPSVGVIESGQGWVDGAVWFRKDGWHGEGKLHHGNEVVKTAVDLFLHDLPGDLALVRTGAVYRDPVADDVWFHPWDGEPRVVGRDSVSGPGGDPEGDVAAWFEGTELVVYDTDAGAVISRTTQAPVLEEPFREYVGGYEHVSGNGFMHVSADEVVWRSAAGTHRFDLATGTSALLHGGSPTTSPRLEDVHNGTRVWGDYTTPGLSVEIDGRRQAPTPGLEPPGRLSPDGSFLTAPWKGDDGSLGVAFVDVRTGESWVVAGADWNALISWSYGDVAVVRVERGTAGPDLEFLACDAVERTCEQLSDGGGFFTLLPNS